MFSKLILTTFFYLLKTSYSATATFSASNSGVDGYVQVDGRSISVSLDLGSIDYTKIPGGTSCFEDGITYHLHTEWTYGDSTDRVGSSACASTFTGGHYDPYLACSSKSGNTYCETQGGCVTSSSVLNTKNIYVCNSSVYEEEPYACEVGDWSGKYGTLYIGDDNTTSSTGSSFWEVYSADVQGKSVVFHCANTGLRAFCAPFDTTTDSTNSVSQDEDEIVGAIFDYFEGHPYDFFIAGPKGQYLGLFYFDKLGVSASCQSINYRIYDDWKDDNSSKHIGNSACSSVVGSVWDPTVSCLSGSDSSFCAYSQYHLCDVASYSYSCSSSDRYSCSPSDLSGKYGSIDITSAGPYFINGTDHLFPPFDDIIGKSLVLECADSGDIIACAKIETYSPSDFNDSTISTTEPATTMLFDTTMFDTTAFDTTATSEVTTTNSHIETSNSNAETSTTNDNAETSTTSSNTEATTTDGNAETTTTKANKSQGCSYNINILLALGSIGLIWWQSN